MRYRVERVASVKRREDVGRRYLRGETIRQIAAAVGAGNATVVRDLTLLRDDWRENAAIDFDRRMGQELAKLDEVEAAAWEGWEASRRPTVTTLDESSGEPAVPVGAGPVVVLGGDQTRKTSRREATNAGDPSFLLVVERCIERRCKLLGLDAPERHQVTAEVLVHEFPAGWGAALAPGDPQTNGHQN